MTIYAEQRIRETHERADVEELMPGWPTTMERVHRGMQSAANEFHAHMLHVFRDIAGSPQARIEHAVSLLAMPAEIRARLAEELGPEDLERLLIEAERNIAALRESYAKAEDISE